MNDMKQLSADERAVIEKMRETRAKKIKSAKERLARAKEGLLFVAPDECADWCAGYHTALRDTADVEGE